MKNSYVSVEVFDGGFGGVTRETKEYTIDTDCQKFCKMVGQCLIDIENMFENES